MTVSALQQDGIRNNRVVHTDLMIAVNAVCKAVVDSDTSKVNDTQLSEEERVYRRTRVNYARYMLTGRGENFNYVTDPANILGPMVADDDWTYTMSQYESATDVQRYDAFVNLFTASFDFYAGTVAPAGVTP